MKRLILFFALTGIMTANIATAQTALPKFQDRQAKGLKEARQQEQTHERKGTPLLKKAMLKHHKSTDWYEPDTIYLYRTIYSESRISFSYLNGNCIQELHQFQESGAWVSDEKYTYTYDASNNMTEDLYQYWDEDAEAWISDEKSTYTYDASNNMTEELYQYWDEDAEAWISDEKSTWAYDASNNMTEGLYQYWDGYAEAWISGYKSICAYDASNNMIEELEQYWDEDAEAWISNYKYTCVYNASNNMTEDLYQYWDEDAETWINDGKSIYAYDASNNMTEDLYQYWDEDAEAWVNSNKYTYAYDASNNMTEELSQYWDEYAEAWVNDNKYTYAYDESNNATSGICQAWDGNAWYNQDIYGLSVYYNNMQSEYTNIYAYRFTASYIKTGTVGIAEAGGEKAAITIYPNPVGDVLYIQSSTAVEQLIIYDISGRMLKQIPNPSQEINVSSLAKGIYLVKVKTEEGEVIRKIVKE